MNSRLISMLKHLGVFILVEIIFVVIVFRELPHTSLYTLLGLLHLSYWGIVLLAGWIRTRVVSIWKRFLATYLPVVYHLGIHIYAGRAAIEIHAHEYDEHSIIWMIVSAGLLGGLIWAGEWYLHRAVHCETHHGDTHAHCEDDCEHQH